MCQLPDPKPVCHLTDLRQTPDADDHCDKDCLADELQDGRSPLEGGDRSALEFVAFRCLLFISVVFGGMR